MLISTLLIVLFNVFWEENEIWNIMSFNMINAQRLIQGFINDKLVSRSNYDGELRMYVNS